MSLLTSLTDLNGIMLDVTNLTDCSLAIKTNDSYFTGGKSYLCYAVFLGDELCCNTCGTNELCALTGVKFDIVNESTNRDILDRKCVTNLDIRISACVNYVAILKTYGSDDVALLASLILKECDVCASVGVVLDTDYSCRSCVLSLEIDNSVLKLVSAALMTNGDSAVAVTSGKLLLDDYQTLLGSKLCYFLKGRNRIMSSRRCSRLILLCRNSSLPPTIS